MWWLVGGHRHVVFFFFKQKTAYEMRISNGSSDVCSSDLSVAEERKGQQTLRRSPGRPRKERSGFCMKGVANALNERTTMKPTDANDARIALNLLIEWPENPRKTRNDADVVQMSTNLLKAGQLAPLIVFKPTGESLYSVIEGETRRRAFNMNATAGKIDADAEIRCWVMPEDTTLERLLVVAAAANTIRSAMNPIEEMEAYSAMAQAGIKVRAIAETFGRSE